MGGSVCPPFLDSAGALQAAPLWDQRQQPLLCPAQAEQIPAQSSEQSCQAALGSQMSWLNLLVSLELTQVLGHREMLGVLLVQTLKMVTGMTDNDHQQKTKFLVAHRCQVRCAGPWKETPSARRL